MNSLSGLAVAVAMLSGDPISNDGASDSSTTGKIIMFRGPSVWGAALACPIRVRGQEIVELARGTHASWTVVPGRYVLTNKTASVEVNVAAGEVRYLRCMIKPGFLTGRSDLQIVDEETFGTNAASSREKIVQPPSPR